MKLTLCAIALNEETTLPKCLGSVRKVVDEIIVLDTGSNDRTVEVAQSFGAKIYHYQWCNDFSAARNEALKYVTGDWILVLDADETLTAQIIPQIKEVIQREEYILINLLREEIGAQQSPYSLVSRLFRNHPSISFSRPYHALVDDSISLLIEKEPQWQVGYLQDVAIIHTGYEKAVISQKSKYARAQAAMEGFIANHPNDPYVCSKLGALYVESGKIQQGVELLKRGINSKSVNDEILYELHYHLGIAHTRVQNTQQAIFNYHTATKLHIHPRLKLGAYNNLGNLLKAVGDLKGAKTAYEITLKIDPNFAIGYYNLGMTLKAMGLYVDAITFYRQAIQVNPNYAQAYQNLGVVLLKIGDVQQSMTSFNKAIALYEQQDPEEAKRLREGLQEMGF
jgi:glycosyltransferase involved in cell wall biosynthesis